MSMIRPFDDGSLAVSTPGSASSCHPPSQLNVERRTLNVLPPTRVAPRGEGRNVQRATCNVERHALFVAKRLRRVDRRGAARREVAGEDADDAENERGDDRDLPRQRRLAEELERLVALDRHQAEQDR